MVKTSYILCCDWGTSTFRLYLVHVETRQTVGMISNQDGIAVLHRRWVELGADNNRTKEDYYVDYLIRQALKLVRQQAIDHQGLKVLISGMASSTLGFRLLDYAVVPFPMDGYQVVIETINPKNYGFEIYLISGVKDDLEVIRGEEVQLIGLADLRPDLFSNSTLCILPGTHAKHVQIAQQKIQGFKTYMTGEVFQLLVDASILKDVIQKSNQPWSASEKAAFLSGVQCASEKNFFHQLFQVRTQALAGSVTPTDNYYYLSGICIGYELKDLPTGKDSQIVLCANEALFPLYKEAIKSLGLAAMTIFIEPEISAKLAIYGQLKLLNYVS